MIKIKQTKKGIVRIETNGTGEDIVYEMAEGIASFCEDVSKKFNEKTAVEVFWTIICTSADIVKKRNEIDVAKIVPSDLSNIAEAMSKAVIPDNDDSIDDDLPY